METTVTLQKLLSRGMSGSGRSSFASVVGDRILHLNVLLGPASHVSAMQRCGLISLRAVSPRMDTSVQNRDAYQTGGSIAGSVGGSVGDGLSLYCLQLRVPRLA